MADTDTTTQDDQQKKADALNGIALPNPFGTLAALNGMPPVTVTQPSKAAAIYSAPPPVTASSPNQQVTPAPTGGMPGVQVTPEDTAAKTAQQKLADLMAKPSLEQRTTDWGNRFHEAHPGIIGRLGQVGAGLARGIETLGEVAAPGIASAVPGSMVNLGLQRKAAGQEATQAEENAQRAAGTAHSKAETQKAQDETEALKRGKVGQTPDEVTLHDLMTGNNGAPRTNPDTGQPYQYIEAYARVKQVGQDVKPEKDPPLGDKVPQLNEALTSRYQVLNPGKALPPQYVLPANATEKDYARIDKSLEAEERAKGTKAQQDAVNEMRNQALALRQGEQGNARSDRSYQFNSAQLEKVAAPIEEKMSRLSRMQDTLDQHNPQADALVGPELLTVMAGGQGSGLRMNEAEIARIVGGRSVWENLKAKMQHWGTNPDDARSITPDQDRMIRALVSAVQQKLVAKQKILDEARQGLLNSDDPHRHRDVVVNARKQLDSVDAGQGTGGTTEPPRPANVPANYVFNPNGPKGAGWYKPTGQ